MKPQPIRFSVVIPAYNEQQCIATCLAAIEAQSVQALEVIVVDNNCTDETIAIARTFKNVRIIRETRQSIAFARHAGFAASSPDADVVATLDADSVPDSDWLATYANLLATTTVDGVSCRIYTTDGALRTLTSWLFNFSTFTVNRVIGGRHFLFGSNYAVRRAVWLQVHPLLRNNRGMWEDLDLTLVLGGLGYTTGHCTKKLVGVSVRGADLGIVAFSRLMSWWPRTYWRYQKASAVVSVFCVLVTVGIVAILRPIVTLRSTLR